MSGLVRNEARLGTDATPRLDLFGILPSFDSETKTWMVPAEARLRSSSLIPPAVLMLVVLSSFEMSESEFLSVEAFRGGRVEPRRVVSSRVGLT